MSTLASTLAAAPAGVPALQPPPPSPATGGAPAEDAFSLSALCHPHRRSNNNNGEEEEEGAGSPPTRAKLQAGLWASRTAVPEVEPEDVEESEDEEGSGAPSASAADESDDELDDSQLRPRHNSPAPKRNKRKNFKPRNILYSLDEDGELVEDTSASERTPLDLSDGLVPAKRRSTILPRRLERLQDEPPRLAMDLSVRASAGGGDEDELDEERVAAVEGALMAQQYAHLQSQLHAHLQSLPMPIPHPGDASAMREYAESTMKELLGIYGLNDLAESITKHVPIANFASGKYIILSFLPFLWIYDRACKFCLKLYHLFLYLNENLTNQNYLQFCILKRLGNGSGNVRSFNYK
jgi:hypothetical protein